MEIEYFSIVDMDVTPDLIIPGSFVVAFTTDLDFALWCSKYPKKNYKVVRLSVNGLVINTVEE